MAYISFSTERYDMHVLLATLAIRALAAGFSWRIKILPYNTIYIKGALLLLKFISWRTSKGEALDCQKTSFATFSLPHNLHCYP